MATRITTLIENNRGEHLALIPEHGISFFIEHNDTILLFDSGQSGNFLHNARELNIDLRSVQHVVLSHGHYDHTNGLPFMVQEVGKDFTVHIHRDFMHPKYATDGLSHVYLGPSYDERWLNDTTLHVQQVNGTGYEIAKGIHLVTQFGNTHPKEVKNARFIVQRPGADDFEIDDFRDEVSIVLETPKGLIVLVGCSHPGIMNMLSTIKERFSQPIHAVLGGTHLVEAHGERLEEALAFLQDGSIGKLGLSHCTGAEAMDALEHQSSVFYRNVTGTSLLVP